MLELSRVYTWLRQWSYTGVLREQSHVAVFSVRLFSQHSWEFHRLWLKTLTGSSSYEMQQTWQRLSISLTAFSFLPSSLLLFSFVECGSMQQSPQGTLQLQQMGGTHCFHSPKAGAAFPYCSPIIHHLKTLPAFPEQECSCNTLLRSPGTGWVTDVDFPTTFSTEAISF